MIENVTIYLVSITFSIMLPYFSHVQENHNKADIFSCFFILTNEKPGVTQALDPRPSGPGA